MSECLVLSISHFLLRLRMSFGGIVFRVTDLTPVEFAISIGLGFLALPVGALARLIPYPRSVSIEVSKPTEPPAEDGTDGLTISIPSPTSHTNLHKSISAPVISDFSRLMLPIDFNQVRGGRPSLSGLAAVENSSAARRKWSIVQEAIRGRKLRERAASPVDRESPIHNGAPPGHSASLEIPDDH
jgi:hypothetical protein